MTQTARPAEIQLPRRPGQPRTLTAGVRFVLPALLTAAALLTPLLVITGHGLSLVGATEESTGYRYFYSLRYLYTPDERPWVPQGQAMTIVHMAIQLLLTAAGYPYTQLQPRMDLFVWVAVALPHIATAVALAWAVLPLRSVLARLAVAGALLVVSLNGVGKWDRHLLLPDYYAWIHTLAMVALGCGLRLTRDEWQPSWRWTAGLGVFIGVCAGLKITLLLLAVVPVLLWLRRQPLRRPWIALGGLAVMGMAAGLTFGGILIVAHAGSLRAVRQLFVLMLTFDALEGHREGTPLLARMGNALLNHPSVVVRLEHVALLAQAAGLILFRQRTITAATVAGTLLSLLLLAVRDTPSTLVEIGDGVLVATVIWVVAVGAPQAGSAIRSLLRLDPASPLARGALIGAQVILCTGLLAVAFTSLGRMTTHYREIAALSNANERQLAAFTADPPGNVAVITIDNEHHPYTSDSAIFKGGINISQSSVWGVSRLVQSIVPNRHYVHPDPKLRLPIDLAPFDYLLFVSRVPHDQFGVTVSLMQKAFNMTVTGFTCPVQLPNPEVGGLQYACKRTPDAPLSEHQGEIAFVPDSLQVLPKFLAFRPDGSRRMLEVGEVVYSGNTSEIWRLNEDWTFTRLRGQPGDTRRIPSIGAWSAQAQALTGLTATFDGVHWRVPTDGRGSLNRNPSAQVDADGALPGWEILAPDATTADMIPDRLDPADDDWLRLRLRTPTDRIGLRTTITLDDSLKGAPIAAILTIRSVAQGSALVRLAATDGTTLGPPAESTLVVGADGRLHYHLRLEPEQITSPQLELLIEQVNAAPGAGIDLQRAEIVAGRYP